MYEMVRFNVRSPAHPQFPPAMKEWNLTADLTVKPFDALELHGLESARLIEVSAKL
jgi:hypothetical protein